MNCNELDRAAGVLPMACSSVWALTHIPSSARLHSYRFTVYINIRFTVYFNIRFTVYFNVRLTVYFNIRFKMCPHIFKKKQFIQRSATVYR